MAVGRAHLVLISFLCGFAVGVFFGWKAHSLKIKRNIRKAKRLAKRVSGSPGENRTLITSQEQHHENEKKSKTEKKQGRGRLMLYCQFY